MRWIETKGYEKVVRMKVITMENGRTFQDRPEYDYSSVEREIIRETGCGCGD